MSLTLAPYDKGPLASANRRVSEIEGQRWRIAASTASGSLARPTLATWSRTPARVPAARASSTNALSRGSAPWTSRPTRPGPPGERAPVRPLVFRQPEHALAQDVAQDLRGAGADAAAAGEEAIELPLPLVRGPGAARGDLRVRSD